MGRGVEKEQLGVVAVNWGSGVFLSSEEKDGKTLTLPCFFRFAGDARLTAQEMEAFCLHWERLGDGPHAWHGVCLWRVGTDHL